VGGSIVRDVGGRVRQDVLVVGIFISYRFGRCDGDRGGGGGVLGVCWVNEGWLYSTRYVRSVLPRLAWDACILQGFKSALLIERLQIHKAVEVGTCPSSSTVYLWILRIFSSSVERTKSIRP
jgi:lipid-A-disaccharide synthase-like uncharacterized protein